MSNTNESLFWRTYNLEQADSLMINFGPLTMAIQHSEPEWMICNQWSATTESDTLMISATATITKETLPILENSERFVLGKTGESVLLKPALADRPVIIKPREPFNLAPGAETKLYVSSPLWISISVGSPSVQLKETPIIRPSDTWFGPSTLEGMLCYASKTHGYLHCDELPMRMHRAVTPVKIVNDAESTFLLERFSLPAPHLKLFCDSESKFLWTQPLTLIREKDEATASLKLEEGPPSEALNAIQIGNPRVEPDKSALTRALDTLFG